MVMFNLCRPNNNKAEENNIQQEGQIIWQLTVPIVKLNLRIGQGQI